MNDHRMYDEHIRSRKGFAASLDDLVEENRVDSKSTHDDSQGDEDALEAYMASIQNETSHKSKKVKVNPMESDSEEEIIEAQPEPKVEDIEADLAAAIAGTSASVNKTTKKLNLLSEREVNYKPFKKNFYVEVPELNELTDDQLRDLRMSLENITVKGEACPKPVTRWATLGLSGKMMNVLKKLNYENPTPIQAQAIPAIMSGRDVIGIAKTGCGKTLSFLLPMFRHILGQSKLEKGEGPIAVIITPTRELALQICSYANKFTRALGLKVIPVCGGPNISEQIRLLKPGAEIIVCTPGRMIEILTVNSGRVTNLNRCTFLVLDEADRLFDQGFEKQIRSIVDLIRPDRQIVMFSATFPPVMQSHAKRILSKYIQIEVGRSGGRSVVCKDVHQTIEIIEEDDKFLRLIPLLQKHVDQHSSAIVFVSRHERADSLLEDLMQAYDPNCLALHGAIDEDDRISTFDSFKNGQTKVLVATSIAARGLDVKNCTCVVNYDVPDHYEDYVHRCGRTGRIGNKGFAYTFITPDQGKFASHIIKALELSEQKVPDDLQKLWDEYKTETEKLGKKLWSSSGFSGRGYKFDEAEAQLVNEKKKHQKKSLGLEEDDDEEEVNGVVGADTEVDAATLESEIRSLAGGKSDLGKTEIRRIGPGANKTVEVAKPTAAIPEGHSKLDLVKQRFAMILSRKHGIPTPIPPILPTPVATTNLKDTSTMSQAVLRAKQLAEQRALAVNAKLGPNRPPTSDDKFHTNPNPTPQRLEMKFEINDYNQQVRRRLTSKEALAQVSELCEVGITVRGQFCAPGDRPLEPKLYLAIEGTSKDNLEKARRELLLVVKDEYTKGNSAPATRGRYRLL